jgi:4-amino-4-deoxy-L-arabinose transferase-like glycosyltransferase
MSIKPPVSGRSLFVALKARFTLRFERRISLENIPASGKPISDSIPRTLVINLSLRPEPARPSVSIVNGVHHYLPWLLCLVCLVVVFVNLGSADLFEPDEGRNAEKAREILLLKDWVTPHENFLPVLDKPMAFYWLVALCYKFFSISEWSGRLPSALTALGCLFLVYRFARQQWGLWEASWSVLILLTSVQFFLLSRVVIADMTLTFTVTLALSCFYSAINAEDQKTKKLHCWLMYGALGAGTLVKGLIGLVIPGLVSFAYLLVTKKWRALRHLHLIPGILFFLVIVAPWYLWVDARNPGYLSYYFWDEHFNRYLTDEFERDASWFYFLLVLAVGFLPWTLWLPWIGKVAWQKLDDKNLFLILWTVLPFLFFSLSSSQLPHYLLLIYPPLAILSGQTIAAHFSQAESKKTWFLYLPWIPVAGTVLYFFVGGAWPHLLPAPVRDNVSENLISIGFSAGIITFILGVFVYANWKGLGKSQLPAYLRICGGMALFAWLVGQFMTTVAASRSAKTLAQSAAPFITHESQIAIYDTYLTGLIFYLRRDRPIWVVGSPGKKTWMGSPYVSRHFPNRASRHDKILVNVAELAQAWKKGTRPVLVFAKAHNIPRFRSQLGDTTKELVKVGEYVLVSKP